ncbi:uncharacterized protein LOC129589460 [Paramacrobiotus metropolitanus]|uniref:uncharacterized protein LOC129589460 n=1 Tax=Paramacrobiotus metropolitanus TaxID=2943436 RepID=UPI002445C083|nr:uncharacterized protein LOC129589460 [Paramacrobiotus metropolitanus]
MSNKNSPFETSRLRPPTRTAPASRRPVPSRSAKKRRTRPISRKNPTTAPDTNSETFVVDNPPDATPSQAPPIPAEVAPLRKTWADLTEPEKCRVFTTVFTHYRSLVYPHHDRSAALTICTEPRSRTLDYFQSEYFLEWCHAEFRRDIGGLPHLLYYPDVESSDFEAFAYHILVTFPTIIENIRRYKGSLPNSVLAGILGLNQPEKVKNQNAEQRSCGLQTNNDVVDVDHVMQAPTEPERRPFLEHRRRRSAQLFTHKAFIPVGSSTSEHHYSISQYHVIPYHEPQETSALDITTIRPPLPEIFADNDVWYVKARKLLAFCGRTVTEMLARECAAVVDVVCSVVMARYRRRVRFSEEEVLYALRRADAERKALQRKEAGERAEMAERESGDTYAFVWAVVRSLAGNFIVWWRKTTAARIYVEQALQAERLPLSWKLFLVEREMDFLGYQQLQRAGNDLPHSLEDCLYYIHIGCRMPGDTLDYTKWKEEFTDMFHLMQEYGKVIRETNQLIEQKMVDYEDNLHYYRILYDLMVPDSQKKSLLFLDWKTNMFIMSDPIDDFGKMNMLPLQHLLFFARYYPTYLNQIMQNSLHPQYGWPFGLAASYLTKTLKDLLDQGKLKTYLYALKPNRHFMAHYFALWCLLFWELDKIWRLYQGGPEELDPLIRTRYAPLFAPAEGSRIPSTWLPTGSTGRDEMHPAGTEQPIPVSLRSKWTRSWKLSKTLFLQGFMMSTTDIKSSFADLQKAQVDLSQTALNVELPFWDDVLALTELNTETIQDFPWLIHPEESFNQLHDEFLRRTAEAIQDKREIRDALVLCFKDWDPNASDAFSRRHDAVHKYLLKTISNSAFASVIPTPGFCVRYLRNDLHRLNVQEAVNVLAQRDLSLSDILQPIQARTTPPVIELTNADLDEPVGSTVMQTRANESRERTENLIQCRGELSVYYRRTGHVFVGSPYHHATEYEDYITINRDSPKPELPDAVRWLEDRDWSESYTGKHKWKLTRKKVRRFLDVQFQDSQNTDLMEQRTDLVDQCMRCLAYQHQVPGSTSRVKLGNPVTNHPVNLWFKVKFAPIQEIIQATLEHFLSDPFSSYRMHLGPFHHLFTVDDEFVPWLYVEEQERKKQRQEAEEKEKQQTEYCATHRERVCSERTVEKVRRAKEVAAEVGVGADKDPLAIRWKVKFGVNFDRYTAVQRLQEKQKQG